MINAMSLPVFAAPKPTPDAQPFWDATGRRRLLVKRCGACGELHFYPRPHCPFCGSGDTRWEAVSGGATLYTFTVVRKWDISAAVAVVELDEGPRLPSLVVAREPASLVIGQRLKAAFAPAEDGFTVVVFVPESSDGAGLPCVAADGAQGMRDPA